ncbi:MAG: SufS family cysteine desulfurase [Lewinellaceae bacterium]|nr:SufS family cysteine desulfurase [Lewinellaceae bacterium]
MPGLAPSEIRQQFPIFSHHPELAYLDNAATTQKPRAVIDGLAAFYEKQNANIHRGIYSLSAQATLQYEQVRRKVAALIGAPGPGSIVYTSGATAGINLVASSFLLPRLRPGDEVLISAMEHHANLIPWQMACRQAGARLGVIPMSPVGELDMAAFRQMLSGRVKMLAITHLSNTLGTINPVEEMTALAHRKGIPVLVDGAQSAAHLEIDVAGWGVDFFAFSGHKLFGPTGIGILYGRAEHLEAMQPVIFGGDMVRNVTFEETSFAAPPQRFEAGTTHIAGVIGLGCAVDFVSRLDRPAVRARVEALGQYARALLAEIPGLRFIGEARQAGAIVSFVLDRVHPHDLATFLSAEHIAVRAGHHCTQPIMQYYGIPGTTRASFTLYNTREEAERLAAQVREAQKFFT